MIHSKREDYVLIAIFAAIPVLLLQPFQNTPFVDDWVYAWSVEHLLKTGQLRILDASTSLHIAQIFWGALFCLPFGFSLTALRISTWVASLLGLFGFYNLMRIVGISRRDALISTALLESCPVFFMLSFTYMTDVPWLVASIWFAYFLIKSVSLQQDRWLAAATVFAFIAGAIRLTGVVLPLIAIAVLWLHAGTWGRQPRRLCLPLVALFLMILVVSTRSAYTEHLADPIQSYYLLPARRIANLKVGFLLLYKFVPEGVICAATTLGIFLLPWVAGSVWRTDLRRVMLVCGAILLILIASRAAGGKNREILGPGATWSLYELGGTEHLINPYRRPPPMANWSQWPLGLIAYSTLAIAVALAIRRPAQPGIAALQWLLAGEFFVICVLWLFFDRYFLMALPFIAVLVVQKHGFVRPVASLAIGLFFMMLSIVGVHDHLDYNRAVWNGVAYLRDHGVKDREIHAGYPVNGWLQYAHPENAPRRTQNGAILVPWVNDKFMLPYQISNERVDGWREVKVFPYKRWLSRSGSIFLLERGDSLK